MRCTECKRLVGSGIEARKMIVEYVQDDGSTKTFGLGLPTGALANATGRLHRGFHSKCYWIAKKRDARGETGRVVAAGITAYTPAGSVDLSQRLADMRAIATSIGLPIGDPHVTEAYYAHVHGDEPYAHTHTFPLDTYQLLAHLMYAHGLSPEDIRDHPARPDGLHAALHRLGHTDPPPRDWRDQQTLDV